MHKGGSSNSGPAIFRKCQFGHLVRVTADDARIDVTLCPVCMRRSIALRRQLGEVVPPELIELARVAEGGS